MPCEGPAAIAKTSASPSGSEPVRVTAVAASSAVLTDWGSALGARFVLLTVQAKDAAAVSVPSDTVTVTSYGPAAV